MNGLKFTFNFNKKKSKTKNKPISNIIKKNIIGIVGIELNGTYYVLIDNVKYPLTLESYNVKGKEIYYAITLYEKKTLTIMRNSKRTCNSKKYLPFYVGAIVKGSTYLIHGLERFNLKKVLDYKDLDESQLFYYKNKVHEFKEFFRNNYEQILQCMM